jgi:para-aminobenzoate synthetase/4-amino-4-deoxychorismate lyase
VAIRTVVVDRRTGAAVYGTGGGITWGSRPDAEHAELHAKAAVLAEPYEAFALLETMALLPGGVVRSLDEHLDRLAGSAAYFGFPLDDGLARARMAAAVAGVPGPARVRMLLDRSGAVEVRLGPPPPPAPGPVRLMVDDDPLGDPVDPGDRWLYHKTTRRRRYEEAAARHPDVDDVVLLNTRGEVTETTIANLAVRLGGTWFTPPLSAGCLPGVERGRLLRLGRLRERDLTPADLRHAEGLALVSSLRGWRPAVVAGPAPAAAAVAQVGAR